ncbi:Gfo/Idh/MocA family protein [Microcella sp.]|uniref:Gfo/Idh/MocA family protein n=1 Tax=Microcella sp. TaxID=1913979 RepID=UPI002569B735|nr:Gfo/Idh/MocA family oxidoreductase [Microcella sp.]MBX9471684.1 Gfo/Idh/MocA family oxidoreductase [Microcella sp.]
MPTTLGIAMVGCGGIARSHAFALTKVPDAKLIASVDLDEAAALRFKERFGFETHSTDLAAVLARTDVDAVVISTSSKSHGPLIIQALEAGKHVLVQKPMTATVDEARAALALADERGLKLMVSFFELFLPPVERAREIIEAGLIGEPFLFKAIMAWHTPDVTTSWRFDPALAGGGIMLDGNVHHVSNALYLLGNPEVQSVYAEYGALTADIDVEDTAVIVIRTDKAILEISGSNRLQEPGGATMAFKDQWAVYGTKGTVQWDAAARPTFRVFTSEPSATNTLLGNGWISPKLPVQAADHREFSMHINGEESPWVPEHQHFVDACLNDTPVRSDARFGLKTQLILDAAYESGRQGRKLPIGS